MTGYQTRQRNQLLSFFESHPDEAFTIEEITQQMRSEQGAATPSRSTVYRTVADLERESCLKRTYLASSAAVPINIVHRTPARIICRSGAKGAMR